MPSRHKKNQFVDGGGTARRKHARRRWLQLLLTKAVASMLRAMVLRLLATLCVWHCLLAQVDIRITPPFPTSKDSIVAVLDGTSGNILVRLDFQRSRTGSTLMAQLDLYNSPLTVVMPWSVKDTIGLLPAGTYTYSLTLSNYASNFQGGYILISRQSFNRVFSVSPPTQVETASPVTSFSLAQNYPNPFNPTTTIRFHLPSQSFVTLTIFDALGKEVSVLVSKQLFAGTYEQQWNAASLPTGVYFYRLQAGSFVETRKLILLR
jgi:hypothetical protein